MKLSLKDVKQVGKKLNIDFSKYPAKLFKLAMEIELEHGKINKKTNVTDDDLIKTGKIALAHINEFPDYYERLIKLERSAEKYWENKKKYSILKN